MKALDWAFIAAGIASLSMLIAVSSFDDNEKDGEKKPSKQTLAATIGQGVWRVTYSNENENEKDQLDTQFNDYQFQFSGNGSIVAANGSSTISGIWSAFDSPNGLKFNVEFPLETPFNELNDVWVVVEQTDSKVTLQDKSVRSGKMEKISLERV